MKERPCMKLEDIKINQLIEVSVDEENTAYRSLASRIEGVSQESFQISVPMHRGSILPVALGTRLVVFLIYRGDAYTFKTAVSGRLRDPIPLLSIKKPDSIQKIQRRFWVRMPVTLPVGFSTENPEGEYQEATGQSIDLSGGGMLLMTEMSLQPGQTLNLAFELPGGGAVICKSRVLRIFRDENTSKNGVKAAMEFFELSERSRDRIVKFIFDRQREWIKKGVSK